MHNTRRSRKEPLTYIPELIRFEKSNKKQSKSITRIMAEEVVNARTLLDTSVPCLEGIQQSITRHSINSNNFEIKPLLLQMIQSTIQIYSLAHEDSNDHIVSILKICDILKYNGVSDDDIRLRLFSFTLKAKAKAWLKTQPIGSFARWDDLAKAYLASIIHLPRLLRLLKKSLLSNNLIISH